MGGPYHQDPEVRSDYYRRLARTGLHPVPGAGSVADAAADPRTGRLRRPFGVAGSTERGPARRSSR